MLEKLISIIVPIYNVEKYLVKCVESIMNQTYSNIEIILVNDGSTDQSGEICESLATKDKRIKVIHKKNGGLSDARNTGIEAASGELIGFVDSDDYIHPQMYEILLNNLVETNSDISFCDFQKFYENEEVSSNILDELKNSEITTFSNFETLGNLFTDLNIQTIVAWNKLYKKSLFKTIRYPKGKIHEDEFTTYKLIYNSKKVVFSNLKLYFYLQRRDSIMGRAFNVNRLQALEAYKERTQFFKEINRNDLYIKSAYVYLRAIIRNYLLAEEEILNKELLNNLRELFFDEYRELNIINSVSLVKKINLLSFKIHPKLTKLLVDLNKFRSK